MGKKRKCLIGILLLFSTLLLVYILTLSNTVPESSGNPDAVPNSPDEGAGGTSTGPETDTSTGSSTGSSTGTSSESSNENSTETQNETPSESQPDSEGEMFVIPENPLGTIGIITAFALAFGMFTQKKLDIKS